MKGVIKRVMAVFLSLMLGLMLAACGGKEAEQTEAEQTDAPAPQKGGKRSFGGRNERGGD